MSVKNPLDNQLQYLKGIGEKRAKLFASLGIYTISDLLYYFPRTYEDWQTVYTVAEAPLDTPVCVKVLILSDISAKGTHSGKVLYGTIARDETDFLNIIYWNNKYVQHMLHEGDEVYLYGKITLTDRGGRSMTSPQISPVSEGARLHAVYPAKTGLSSKQISSAVEKAFECYFDAITESLPAEQIQKYRLETLRDALRHIHFPSSQDDISGARRRLIYEELLTLQLGLLRRGKGEKPHTECVIEKDYSSEFASLFPHPLTNAQNRAIGDCIADMKRNIAMCRLVQGDVGSGKTAVAASLIYTAVKNGYQCVLMAPTEVLAVQHADTFASLFAGTGINIELLTGSVRAKNKKIIKDRIASGEVHLVIGTHAVITDDVAFSRLGLVITDEQHRFGVMQRAKLRAKGGNPHVLVMSATPIPRTLSLIIYGDLDVSILDEKPMGRLPIKTYTVGSSYHPRIYNFIKKEVTSGRQCYIVCPLVEENEDGTPNNMLSAEEYYERLSKNELKGLSLGLLHGKMKQKDKDEAMARFISGETDVLVCTVVIEVGIDVPNATLMVIENAERFGLSQLHQLRGRVGRSSYQSHCILVSDAKGKTSQTRLDVMCSTTDGFKIADEDLKLRGPGDFFGSRQSGLPMLNIADLMTDSNILFAARKEAEAIISQDALLKNPAYALLRQKTDRLFTDIS